MANEANPAVGPSKLFPGLQDASQTSAPAKPVMPGPSLPKASSDTLSEESKNVFTELFGSEGAQKTPGVMNAVVQQTEKKNLSYFNKPRTEELSIKKFTTHKANPGATLLKASILVLFLTGAVFSTQTSSRFSIFGVNPALQVETKQAQVQDLTAEVRVQKYLASVLLLDQFSSLADEYLYNLAQAESAYTSSNKQDEHAAFAEILEPELATILTQVQSYMDEAIPSEELAYSIAVADEMIAQLQAEASGTENQALLQAVQDLETTKALLQDSAFYGMISALNTEAISETDVEAIFNQFSGINASLTAMINVIQSSRTDWSVYLDAIEDLTKEVDPLFNTEFSSSLSITSVVFNDDDTITVSGNSSTNDTKNFTLVSNLIDAYEDSEYFSSVSERNYQKSGSDEDQTYTGSFRILMVLESNTPSDE